MDQHPRAWRTLLSHESLALLERIDNAVAALCEEYIEDLKRQRIVPKRKILQDSLWGFIDFSPVEIAIIDSPLLQRLRFIRQLGFAYLLFPNAGYSRFEHSLGVCHVIKEFARILNDAQPTGQDHARAIIKPADLTVLSMAALMHDVGHIAFSHVSERGLQHFSNYQRFFEDVRAALKQTIKNIRKKPKPSEILSICICSSPSVVKLLEHCISNGLLHLERQNAASAVDRICEYVIGATTSPDNYFMAEMISGDMDADKLDYIPRDCMVTGVPLPFDVRRLILKTRHFSATSADGIKSTRLAVSLTGARALMDLTVSRTILRQKIYRHPKVAASEAMLENALELLASVDIELMSPEQLLLVEDDQLLGFLIGLKANRETKPSSGQNNQVVQINSLAKGLKERRLLKRAFVFSAHFLDGRCTQDDRSRLLNLVQTPEACRLLRKEIFAELKTILTATDELNLCPLGEESIAVVPTDLTVAASGSQHQPLILDDDNEIIPESERSEHLDRNIDWASASEAGGVLHYVFAPTEVRAHCYVATRNVLARNHNLTFRKLSLQLAKIPQRETVDIDTKIFRELETNEKLDYEKILLRCSHSGGRTGEQILRILGVEISEPARMTVVEDQNAVNVKLAEVSIFEGHDGRHVDLAWLQAWLSQFDSKFHRIALHLFLKMTFLNRGKFKTAILAGISGVVTKIESVPFTVNYCPLTRSGDFMCYAAADLPQQKVGFPKVADAIEAISNTPAQNGVLLILDDVLGMGKQVVEDVLPIWHGEKPARDSISLTEELPQPSRSWLRNSNNKIVFVFAFALREGKVALEAELKRRGISAQVVSLLESSVGEGVFGKDSEFWDTDKHLREEFKQVCQRIGKQLLKERAAKKNWPPEKLEGRALGYSSASQLIATFYNCPTITLPILWAEGEVDGRRWLPLFSRRHRD